jgi:hypothetical protein
MLGHQQRAEAREQFRLQVFLYNFRLSIILKESEGASADKIKNYVTSQIKEAELLDESAGALMYSIPFSQTPQITQFLHNYESESEIRSLIEDMSISNSTLEEVFIKVTKDDEDQNLQTSPQDELVNLRERPTPSNA